MRYEDVVALRKHHPAWRLLRADHAPLVLSFLHRIFVAENARSVTAAELISQLDDELYALNERFGEGTFPKPAADYLNDWARPEVGWLRKYYPAGSDEAHFDATPAVEKALGWLRSLQPGSRSADRTPARDQQRPELGIEATSLHNHGWMSTLRCGLRTVCRVHSRQRLGVEDVLIHDRHIRITHATTGALIRELTLDPTRHYQPLKPNKPNP